MKFFRNVLNPNFRRQWWRNTVEAFDEISVALMPFVIITAVITAVVAIVRELREEAGY